MPITNISYRAVDKHYSHQRNVRRLTLTAFILAGITGSLGVIQWVTGLQGSLLWIGMVVSGFLLIGVLIKMIPGRSSSAGNNRGPIAPLPWEEPSWYDSSHPGSPFHRED